MTVALLGLCLMAGGQAILANHESAAAFVNRSLGRSGPVLASLMMDTFGRGVALGLGILLLGALLVAVIIGLPKPEGAPPHETPGDPTLRASVWQVAPGRAAVAGILAAVSLVGLSRSEPGMAAVIFWLGTLGAVFLLVRALDRARHSLIESPFHHHWEWIFLLALVAAVLVLVGHDLTHYRWAGTPDESFFFIAAKGMANGRLRPFPLSEDGVFGFQPALSSYYQAAFLKVFGTTIFSWRLSSAFALAISLPFLYLFTREIWSRRAGVIATVLLGTAQLAVGFAHFGYNNVQVYPVIFASLAILAWAIRCRSLAGHYLAGVIAGMGFYTIYTARLAPLLALLLLWSFGRLSLKRAGAELWALVVGILLAVLPALIHPATLVAHMLQHTTFATGAALTSSGWRGLASLWLSEPGRFLKVWGDWLQSIFYASWSKSDSNFSWSPPVDPVVGALSVLGLWLGVLALLRRSRARFVTPAFLFSAFVVGAISEHPVPPLTRLLTLVPFTAILAAIALDRLMTGASRWVRWQAAVWLAGSALVAAAVIWNVTALHRSIYDLHYGFGSGTTSELIRMTQALPGNSRLVYIQNAENDMYDVDYILHEYNLGDRTTYIRPFGPQALTALGEISPPFAVVLDLKRAEELQTAEGSIERRFPGVRWHDSAPGRQWNLRYCSVPAGLIVAP